MGIEKDEEMRHEQMEVWQRGKRLSVDVYRELHGLRDSDSKTRSRALRSRFPATSRKVLKDIPREKNSASCLSLKARVASSRLKP